MSSTLERIRQLAAEGSVRISDHGYAELAADGILAGEVLAGVESAQLVEEYPHYGKGSCALVLGGRPKSTTTRRVGHRQKPERAGSFGHGLAPGSKPVGK